MSAPVIDCFAGVVRVVWPVADLNGLYSADGAREFAHDIEQRMQDKERDADSQEFGFGVVCQLLRCAEKIEAYRAEVGYIPDCAPFSDEEVFF